MSELPNCPECDSEYTYPDGTLLMCPDCGHAFSEADAAAATSNDSEEGFADAFGTPLVDGDTVTVIKDLKVKGTSLVLKIGTKAKNIRLSHASDHEISCKIKDFGAMMIRCKFVKKG